MSKVEEQKEFEKEYIQLWQNPDLVRVMTETHLKRIIREYPYDNSGDTWLTSLCSRELVRRKKC